MTVRKVTPESIIRAMDVHKANGLIRDWRHWEAAPWKRGGTERPFYLLVDLVDGDLDPFELKNLREATVFVAGLASAHHAMLRSAASRDDAVLHEHDWQGQKLRHAHAGGGQPHGYFGHPEDADRAIRHAGAYRLLDAGVPGADYGQRRRVEPGEDPEAVEKELRDAGRCDHQTAYGLPWIEYCGRPRPCGEHAGEGAPS